MSICSEIRSATLGSANGASVAFGSSALRGTISSSFLAIDCATRSA
jgi:hypothetical protein